MDDAVIAAVRKWVTSIGADFYKLSMQALVHRCQKCIASCGDYAERKCFVAENLLYPMALLCTLHLL
jgi:hypothetical protein